MPTALKWLIPPIFLLALFAAAMGLFYQAPGESYEMVSFRGEPVTINARGLYYYDTVSSAVQMQGNDIITLAVGLPLLAISAWLTWRGSLRGKLLLTGTLGFFLYTYISMSMLTAFNPLFLVYVALFALSLYAFIISLISIDLNRLPGCFSPKLPVKLIGWLIMLPGLFLLLAWIGRVLQGLRPGAIPALDNTTTMVIQAMDLALIVPFSFLSGILLLRRSRWGYLLATTLIMKSITMGLAVSTMNITMALAGVSDSVAIVIPFFAITLINLALAVVLLKNVRQPA